jgi:hypothetical protein
LERLRAKFSRTRATSGGISLRKYGHHRKNGKEKWDLTEKNREVKQEEMVDSPGKEMNLTNNDPRIIFMMLPLLWRSKYF